MIKITHYPDQNYIRLVGNTTDAQKIFSNGLAPLITVNDGYVFISGIYKSEIFAHSGLMRFVGHPRISKDRIFSSGWTYEYSSNLFVKSPFDDNLFDIHIHNLRTGFLWTKKIEYTTETLPYGSYFTGREIPFNLKSNTFSIETK